MKLDVLAISPHPDDAELHCAGLLLQAQANGGRIGVLVLTRGELGSRGDPEQRARESAAAGRVLALDVHEHLAMPDGFVRVDDASLSAVVDAIRRHRPALLVAPHWDDHHPDHVAASELARQAAYLSGLVKYPAHGTAHRPEQVLYYLDRVSIQPDLVVDVTPVMQQKEQALRCHAGQLFTALDTQAQTPLSQPRFLDQWRARHTHFGALIGVEHGEAYVIRSPVPVRNPLELCWGRRGMV